MESGVRPVVIIVRDGWGKNPLAEWNNANAVFLARHPVADRLLAEYPNTTIHTSGFDVGLPEGTMGNSEVGHQNIGAGRVVDQESVKITKDVRNGDFFSNTEMVAAVDLAIKNNTNLHLFGIVSDAGVHGRLEHLFGCLQLAKNKGLDRVFLHAFTDGRDTPPNSGLAYIQEIQSKMAEIGVGIIATVSGRFYAMDRDNRWPRVEKAYKAIAFGDGAKFADAVSAVQHYYTHPDRTQHDRRRIRHAVGHLPPRRHALGHRQIRRRRHLLQLPRRPPARDHQGVRQRRLRRIRPRSQTTSLLRYDDRVRNRPARPRRLPQAAENDQHLGRLRQPARPQTVPLRRDRKVPPRHVFLQRLPRGTFPPAKIGRSFPRPPTSAPTTRNPK